MAVAGGQGRRVVVVPNHLAVGRRSPFYSRALLLLPGQGVLGHQHADAGVDTRRGSLETRSKTKSAINKMDGRR